MNEEKFAELLLLCLKEVKSFPFSLIQEVGIAVDRAKVDVVTIDGDLFRLSVTKKEIKK